MNEDFGALNGICQMINMLEEQRDEMLAKMAVDHCPYNLGDMIEGGYKVDAVELVQVYDKWQWKVHASRTVGWPMTTWFAEDVTYG